MNPDTTQRWQWPSRRAILLGSLLALLLLPSTRELARHWELDPTYSHGWLVPVFLFCLLYQALRRTPAESGEVLLGVLESSAGGLLLLATQVLPWPLLMFAAYLLLGRGVLLATGGRSWANAGLLPLAFTFFMCPLPVPWTATVAVWLQSLVSWTSAGLLSFGWVCLRQGNTLLLAGLERPLVVAEGCSGLRQLLAFLGLAFFVGVALRRPLKQVLLLLALAVPCAVLANTSRVLLMVVGTAWFGGDWTLGWLHDLPALLTLPLGFLLFLGLARLLPNAPQTDPAPAQGRQVPTVPRLLVLAVGMLVLAAGTLHWHLEAGTPSRPPRVSLAVLPLHFSARADSPWSGRDNTLPPARERQFRFADEYLHRTYGHPDWPFGVQLFAAYSATGRDREHHPEVCIRDVGGATEDRGARALIPLGDRATAQRFGFRQPGQPPLTLYYWHYTLPEPAAESITLLQRLHRRTHHRPASVTVEVSVSGAHAILTDVEARLLPILHRQFLGLLPQGASTGHDRLAIRLDWQP